MRVGPLVFLCGALAAHADVSVIDEIVAKVNGDIITKTEISRSREQLREDLERQGAKGETLQQALQQRETDILRDRIDQLLVIQKGKELNINVDPEVSKEVAAIQERFKIVDPDKFSAFIKEQTGMSIEDYRQELRNRHTFQRVIRQEVGSRINIPKAELRKYYDEHQNEFVREDRVFLREILVSNQGRDEAAAEKKAKELVERARKGERFFELARDNSDASTAPEGGALNPAKREDLSELIRDQVWNKERGTITDPIKLSSGYLILRVEDQHKAGIASFEEVENEIMERLYMPRFEPQIRVYLTDLRKEAFLELKPGYVDSAAATGKDTTWSDPLQLRPETVTKEEVANLPPRRKRLLWMVPVPGTQTEAISSSKQ
jgi:parvulin-like peptidyl-prolyl isomerase